MTVQEYKGNLNQALDKCLLLKEQINALSLMGNLYTVEKNPVGVEQLCKYDLPELWGEYTLKFKKCVYFLEHYCQGILNELDLQGDRLHGNNIFISPGSYLEEAIFNFDSFILATSVIMEYEERDYLAAHFKKADINSIYPQRDEIGLNLQVNILRNRIVHHTGGRYINGKECSRFVDFSSNVQMIRVQNENISLQCTQIDVYKDGMQKVLPAAIQIATEQKVTVFDILFPSKSGKGHGKRHPTMVIPDKDIYFDHADTGIKIVPQIQEFLRKLNQVFFEEFYRRSEKKEELLNVCTVFCDDKGSFQYQIKNIFECEENS